MPVGVTQFERWFSAKVLDGALLVGAFAADLLVVLMGALRGRYFGDVEPTDLPFPFWVMATGALFPIGFFLLIVVSTHKEYRRAQAEAERQRLLLHLDAQFIVLAEQPPALGVLSTVYGRSVLWPIAGALAAAAAKVIWLRSGVRRSRETPLQRETEDAASGRPAGAGHD